jgi:hypothetical protein
MLQNVTDIPFSPKPVFKLWKDENLTMRKLALFLAVPLMLLAANSAYAGSVTAPTITTQPANATVAVGKTATFAVVASGTTPLSYQWYKNGSSISGAIQSSYTTPALTNNDNYTSYYVTVANSAGSVTSNQARLTVVTPPTINQQPTSITVTAPAIATFDVEVNGTWPMKFQWYKNGAAIRGATDQSYSVQETSAADNGAKFAVKATNAAGSVISKSAILSVQTTTAGTYPIVGTWAGTVTAKLAEDSASHTYAITAAFAQNAYSLNATIAYTGSDGETEFGAGIASLNTLNMYTSFDADGATASIAGAFSTDKLTFTGTATGADGASGTGKFTISSDKKTLTGTANDSLGDSFTFTLKRK